MRKGGKSPPACFCRQTSISLSYTHSHPFFPPGAHPNYTMEGIRHTTERVLRERKIIVLHSSGEEQGRGGKYFSSRPPCPEQVAPWNVVKYQYTDDSGEKKKRSFRGSSASIFRLESHTTGGGGKKAKKILASSL